MDLSHQRKRHTQFPISKSDIDYLVSFIEIELRICYRMNVVACRKKWNLNVLREVT